MSLTHQDARTDRLGALHRELAAIQAGSDRADPLDETALCLAEAAVHAATAAIRLRSGPAAGASAELTKMLGAARAAVVCATYAMTERTGSQPMDQKVANQQRTSREQVLRFYEYVDSDNVAALVELFTEDCEYHRPGYPPRTGRDELATFYRDERVIQSGAHTLTALLADGSNVAAHGRFDGILRSGAEVHIRFADFFETDEHGLFHRRSTYYFAPLV